ncbi:hypothetical protein [Myxococcus sp. AB036A]|uniref:hypothetical protein n=1 Tax=Myxococcus sp. AB036A TaxID=2562793 RepID=UPI00189139B6|nr:hypothetical protein [Myxococcus sp. AB036A]
MTLLFAFLAFRNLQTWHSSRPRAARPQSSAKENSARLEEGGGAPRSLIGALVPEDLPGLPWYADVARALAVFGWRGERVQTNRAPARP